MDFAMRRRFIWEEVQVTPKLLEEAFQNGKNFFRGLIQTLIKDETDYEVDDEASLELTEQLLKEVNSLVVQRILKFNGPLSVSGKDHEKLPMCLRKLDFGPGYDIAHGQFTGIRLESLWALDKAPIYVEKDVKATARNIAQRIMLWVWLYRVQPLLREYLRGKPNADELLDELKAVWLNINPPSTAASSLPGETETQ